MEHYIRDCRLCVCRQRGFISALLSAWVLSIIFSHAMCLRAWWNSDALYYGTTWMCYVTAWYYDVLSICHINIMLSCVHGAFTLICVMCMPLQHWPVLLAWYIDIDLVLFAWHFSIVSCFLHDTLIWLLCCLRDT